MGSMRDTDSVLPVLPLGPDLDLSRSCRMAVVEQRQDLEEPKTESSQLG